MAGAEEFSPDFIQAPFALLTPAQTKHTPAPPHIVEAAYNHLDYSAGYLSSAAQEWFFAHHTHPPRNFHLVTATPVSLTLSTSIGNVGIVMFPQGEGIANTPTRQQIDACLKAGKKLAKNCTIVIGISPWGLVNEKAFLAQGQKVFQCLLGGGDGIGFSHSIDAAAPAIIWLRADSRGKAITALDIYSLPTKQKQLQWQEKINFSADHIYLDETIPHQSKMQKIIAPAAP